MKKLTVSLLFLLIAGIMTLQAQKITITGTVSSAEDGSGVPGASIVVKGTTTGTITASDGTYSISVPEDATALIVSFIGLKTVEVAIAGKTKIDVALEADVLGLDEVVVTAIGITRAQKALGYAVSNVSSDQTLQKSEPDLLRSLQGKVPGVNINGSGGAPGAASRITIRGVSSFVGDNQPLFVVDGLPYSNDQYNTTDQNSGGGAYGTGLSTLDPNNIESVSVLKGAAAAALYGSRAKNGVVVITTKSGSPKKVEKGLQVSVSSSINWEDISNLPEYQNTYGNGVDFDYANANGSWGPAFAWQDSVVAWPTYKNAFGDDVIPGDSVPWVADPDNVESLFETGLVIENSVSIAGGNESSSFSLTASQLNNDGYIPFSEFDRTSISLGGTSELTNGLRANGNFSYSSSTQVGGLFGNNQADDQNAASSFARALWLGRHWDMSLPYTDPATGGPVNWNGLTQYDHPLWSFEHNTVTTRMDRIVGNFGLSYDLTDWINVSYQYGINTFVQRRQQVIDKYSRGYGGEGGIIDDDVWRQEMESNLLLTIDRQLSSDFDIKAIIGHNINQRQEDRQLFQGIGIINDGIYDLDNTRAVVPYNGLEGQYYKRRLVGVFTDISLQYKGYLFLNLSGRNDWSSTLPKDNNSYFFPSVSTSFIFSDAFGLANDIFSIGKVRAGYGQVGMDADPYSLADVYIGKNTEDNIDIYKYGMSPFLGQAAMTTPNLGNDPNLKPEKLSEIELGTDLGFIDNRINLEFTYYNRTSINNIFPPSVAASSGYGRLWTNIGEMVNKGFEVGLNLVPVKMANMLTWSIYTVFTKNTNEVTDIFENFPEDEVERTQIYGLFGDPTIIIQVGEPYGVFYGDVTARDDEDNLLIDQGTGDLIPALEQDIYGDPHPDYKLGVTNTINFKGLSLVVLFDYTKGGDVVSNSIVSLLARGVTKDTEDREHTFIIPGYYGDPNTGDPLLDADGNQIPNETQVSLNDLYFNNSFGFNTQGEWNVYDATVFRLREIVLGYQLPESILSKTPFGSAEISLSGRNLWFFAPNIPEYTNFDPEVNGYGSSNVQGVEYSVAPTVRRYGVNLKLMF
ncbi:SusC/RagA family TonB-linked outer membrane protein [Bacteroidota bacterium]